MRRIPKANLIQVALPVAAALALLGLINNTAVAQSNVLSELRQANSELQAGKSRAAISRLDQVINAGRMTQSNLAQALFMRGRAKQAAGRTAEAIADLNQAIWFGKLSSRQQKEAMALRQKAYKSTGLKAPASGAASKNTVQTVARRPSPVGITNPPTRTTTHKVAQPIISTGRLPEGQRRTAPSVPSAPPPKTTTWPTRTSAAPTVQRRAAPTRTTQTPAPKWSQVVTGTVPSPAIEQRRTHRSTASIKPKPAVTRTSTVAVPKTATIPKFRQTTVPSPQPPQRPIKRAAAPTQTWSPLTQQFTPAPQAPKQPVKQAIAPKQPQVAPAKPEAVSVATRTPPPVAAQDQANPVSPPTRNTQPNTAPSTGTSSIGSLLFGSGPSKSDAIAEADRLQAERRARIRAHNKQFGNQ